MTVPSSPVVLPLALVAGALVLTVAACGGGSQQAPAPTTGSEPTVPVTAASTPTTPASPSAAASSAVTPSTGPAAAGTCTDSDLHVRYADDVGGGGAGSVGGTLTFTNTSTTSCTLRGFPGVSYVTGTKGNQVGQAATRTDGRVVTRTLAAGGSAKAALRRTQPRNYGDSCGETDVAGFRVYPPGSTGAVFVKFAATGCRSTSAPLLQVGPVR